MLYVCVFSAPEDFRLNPGAVETVLQHPVQPEMVSTASAVLFVIAELIRHCWNSSVMQCTVKYRGDCVAIKT